MRSCFSCAFVHCRHSEGIFSFHLQCCLLVVFFLKPWPFLFCQLCWSLNEVTSSDLICSCAKYLEFKILKSLYLADLSVSFRSLFHLGFRKLVVLPRVSFIHFVTLFSLLKNYECCLPMSSTSQVVSTFMFLDASYPLIGLTLEEPFLLSWFISPSPPFFFSSHLLYKKQPQTIWELVGQQISCFFFIFWQMAAVKVLLAMESCALEV